MQLKILWLPCWRKTHQNNRHFPFSKIVINTTMNIQDTKQRCCSHCNKVMHILLTDLLEITEPPIAEVTGRGLQI